MSFFFKKILCAALVLIMSNVYTGRAVGQTDVDTIRRDYGVFKPQFPKSSDVFSDSYLACSGLQSLKIVVIATVSGIEPDDKWQRATFSTQSPACYFIGIDGVEQNRSLFLETLFIQQKMIRLYQVGLSMCEIQIYVAPTLRVSKTAVLRYADLIVTDGEHVPDYVAFTPQIFCSSVGIPVLRTTTELKRDRLDLPSRLKENALPTFNYSKLFTATH